ncbi:MAG: VWA domain-containing protein [Anaerolineales bacterium]|nr:VWA domain-containing protein [Anaerolineales bacterium]
MQALELTSMCNRSGAPLLDQPQLVYILTELAPGAVVPATRLPLNFALVLDRSGSMAGEKLRTMKEAVKNMIDQLDADDLISIIAFETRTQTLIQAQPALNKDELKRKVDSIKAGGGTTLAPALKEGLDLVSQRHSLERVNRIVLLTDGEATDNENDSRKLADAAGERNIPIIGLGFGKDWNEDFLFDLADRSVLAEPGARVGMTDYIPTPAEANRIFQEVYQSMQVVAQDVVITIRMVQGLEARRVWQVAPLIKDLGRGVIQGRAIQIPVGQLEKQGAAYLAEVMLPPRPVGAVRLAQTEATYHLPDQGAQRQTVDLIVNYSQDPAAYTPLNGRVMNILEKVQAFKLQTQALDEAEMGNVSGATRKLRQAVTILLAQGETDLANQMEQEVDRLEQSGQMSSEGKKTIKLTSRKTMKLTDES